jgi:putative membrane protein
MYWGNDHMNDAWTVVMMLGMLVFWTAVVVAVVWALSAAWSSKGSTGTPQVPAAAGGDREPQQILANRLARGEIDPEEYLNRLDALRSTHAS